MKAQKMVVIDFETTGNQLQNGDRIIQIGAAVVSNREIVDTFSTYVNPGIPIPPFITQLTTISDEMVKDAPLFEEIAPKLLTMLDEAYFVAHNVPFDLSFLQMELKRCGYDGFYGPSIDTVELSRLLFPTIDSYKLQDLADYFQLTHHHPHQADSDALVTAEIFIRLLEKLDSLPLPTLQTFNRYKKGLKSNVDVILEEIIYDKETNVWDETTEEYDIFRHLALHKKQSNGEEEVACTLSFSEWKETIDSHLKKAMDTYEIRESQLKMMNDVNYALQTSMHAVIEAGTGTGKSLAYLLPALFKAKTDEESIIVSTHTVQLQEQLMERDLPILKQVLPFSFDVQVLKGRNHYVCLRKFEQQMNDTYGQNYDEWFTKLQLLMWLTETTTGDVEELQLSSGGKRLWYTIQSDANSCLNRKCPWFSRCFYHRARQKAQQAHLVITNHALLFTDLTNDHRLLPKYEHVILDEAHHLEHVASEHFGEEIDYFTLSRMFTQFFEHSGPLDFLFQLVEETDVSYTAHEIEQLKQIGQMLMQEIDDLFTMIHYYTVEQFKTEQSGRLNHRYKISDLPEPLYDCSKRVDMLFYDFLKNADCIQKSLKKYQDHFTDVQKGKIVDIEGRFVKFEEAKQLLVHLLRNHRENVVYWMEVDSHSARNAAFLYSQPIEISDRLADDFFAKLKSVILTSATLSVNGSFSFLEERLGLIEFEPLESIIESPFHYEQQAKVMISSDIPNIKGTKPEVLILSIVEHIFQIAHITKGRMLVLFTSNQMLKETYLACKEHPEYESFTFLAQNMNQGSRSKLTRYFKEFDRAILFGTNSFWEGIDIPGDDLSSVVIVRLPFSPPDNPVFEAQSEVLKAKRKNPFMQLSIPQAVIRFKQGFGRLIRTSQDKGIVYVLDRRIVTTRYGKYFIQSLPNVEIIEAPLEELVEETKQFLL